MTLGAIASRQAGCIGLAAAFLAMASALAEDKLKSEELVARHLASLGGSDPQTARQSVQLSGVVRLTILTGGHGFIEGPASLLSSGRKLSILFNFQRPNYRSDHFVFDGEEIQVAYTSPGSRSALGDFVFSYQRILEEGLLGGVSSTAWPLFDYRERKAKLNYRGLNERDGEALHELEYRMKNSRGVDVKLYFEKDTYRHRLTRYRVEVPAGMGATPETSAGLRRTFYTLEESFTDPVDYDGLTLPSNWRLLYSAEGNGPGIMMEWVVSIRDVSLNVAIPGQLFKLSGDHYP